MRNTLLLLLVVLIVENLFSQTIPQVNIPISVSDGFRTRILYFGLDPSATNGIDPHLDEMEQPPLPPSGIFDARFVGYDIGIPELGEGVLKDYRNGSDTTKGQRIHQLRYQVGSGTVITISWNLPSGVTGLLQDFFGGVIVNKSMSGKDSLVVTNPGILNRLRMTINYNLTGQLLPSAPNLISPGNGSINIPSTTILRWTQVSGAIRYHLQISMDSNFTQIVLSDTAIQTNSREVQLQNNKKYFWRVRVRNNFGWSSYSSTWNFTTVLNPPSPPVLNSPPKGAIGISIPVQFKWFSSIDAENYTISVAEDANFINVLINQTVTDTFFLAQNLASNKKYFWKVIANNSAGSSASSEIWDFTTISTSVESRETVPRNFILHQNFPNPFNSSTVVSYELPNDSFTKFFLYDLQGREILNIDLGYQKAGYHKFNIDLKRINDFNSAGGVFFYRIIAGSFSDQKKMVYLK